MYPNIQLIAGPNNAGTSSLIRVLETFLSDPTADDFSQLKPLNDYCVGGADDAAEELLLDVVARARAYGAGERGAAEERFALA